MTAPDRIYLNTAGDYEAAQGQPEGVTWCQHQQDDGDPMYVLADLLSDPVSVHLNMLRGTIAKPSLAQIAHIYGDEWNAAIAAERADALRMAVDAARQIANHNRDHWREDMAAGADEAADAIEALIPGKETP